MGRHRLVSRRVGVVPGVAGVTVAGLVAAGLVTVWAPSALAVTGVSSGSDLQAAFAAGGTVRLDASITIGDGSNLTAPGGGSVTLDLNGYQLRIQNVATNRAGVAVSAGSALTIEDTSPAAAGSLTVTGGLFAAGIGAGTRIRLGR